MKRTYNKLVRDKMPELIRESGRTFTSRLLENEEYFQALIDKVIEEMDDYRQSGNEEELADVYEALDCLMRYKNYEPLHMDYLKLMRREARGSFEKRILLEDVED